MKVKLNPKNDGVGKTFTLITISLIVSLNGLTLLAWFLFTRGTGSHKFF